MYPFQFDMPTKAMFGVGEVCKVGQVAASFGKKALLLTYDEAFVKQIGFYQKVEDSCKQAGVRLISCFGVKSNPTVEHAIGVIATVKQEKPDVIIALGGGSAIDEAKFVGVAAKYDGDPWNLATGNAPILDTLPVIAVVTIPATSSELNGTSVMSYEKIRRKDGFANPIMRPKVAILDPELIRFHSSKPRTLPLTLFHTSPKRTLDMLSTGLLSRIVTAMLASAQSSNAWIVCC